MSERSKGHRKDKGLHHYLKLSKVIVRNNLALKIE